MCVVMNARHVGKRPATDRVYVGRPSKWGNPFVIGRDGLRDQVIGRAQGGGRARSERGERGSLSGQVGR
jgi:Domain of unknown function (DUF4326)